MSDQAPRSMAMAATREMTRKELIRRFVLNEICDDYENLEMIHKWVTRKSARAGLTVQDAEIIEALAGLIQSGLARTYRFRPPYKSPPDRLSGVPPLKEIGKYYFWATPQGRDLQVSDRSWYPFDDDEELRKDWSVPTQ